jgi:hypothetical protein
MKRERRCALLTCGAAASGRSPLTNQVQGDACRATAPPIGRLCQINERATEREQRNSVEAIPIPARRTDLPSEVPLCVFATGAT